MAGGYGSVERIDSVAIGTGL